MQIAVAVYDRFTALDAVGPYAVLGNLPGAEVVFVAAERGLVADDTALKVEAGARFAEVTQPDVIVVPGGLITRRMARDGHPVIDWIRQVHPTTTWTTSVCTGAILLAAAGVLDGLDATTHWLAYDQLAALGACPTAERVVVRGKVVTGAGVSAGIDMALTLVERMAGTFTAQAIQLGIEYDPQPPFDAGSPAKAPPEVYESLSALMRQAETSLLAGAPPEV
jgi:transcriptional regulator GlxA family with amidase domain